MLRHVVAVGLILIGMSTMDVAAGANGSTAAACHGACMMTGQNLPSVRDEMDDGVARIAVRASVPPADGAPLTQSDLLSLYLLLSLPARTQSGTP